MTYIDIVGKLCDNCLSQIMDETIHNKRQREENDKENNLRKVHRLEERGKDIGMKISKRTKGNKLIGTHLEMCWTHCPIYLLALG